MTDRTDPYRPEQRAWQDRFDTRRLADRLQTITWADHLAPDAAAMVEASPFFFLATVDAEGQPQCSFKGGDPGFVRVLDERTLAFPSYDGNGMFLSLGNVSATAKVGLLFVDFEHPNRLRVEGEATVSADDPLLTDPAWPAAHEAQAVVRVAVTKAFPNCPRYVPRLATVRPSPYVPRLDRPTPFAPWKRLEVFTDALSDEDQARAADLSPLSYAEYAEVVERD